MKILDEKCVSGKKGKIKMKNCFQMVFYFKTRNKFYQNFEILKRQNFSEKKNTALRKDYVNTVLEEENSNNQSIHSHRFFLLPNDAQQRS